jgi:uncharacterized protein YndB with AHSA1/START domain
MPKVMVSSDQDSVVSEIEIAAPAERIFKALTDPDQLMRWFNDATCPVKFWRMDARLGGGYSYATKKTNVIINGVDEFECHGEILEMDPPRLLVYTWIGNWHVVKDRKTVVRWELTPTSAGTRVKVTHSGLVDEPAARGDYCNGWPGVVQNLKEFAEGSLANKFQQVRKD